MKITQDGREHDALPGDDVRGLLAYLPATFFNDASFEVRCHFETSGGTKVTFNLGAGASMTLTPGPDITLAKLERARPLAAKPKLKLVK